MVVCDSPTWYYASVSTKGSRTPKRCCLECHFLGRWLAGSTSARLDAAKAYEKGNVFLRAQWTPEVLREPIRAEITAAGTPDPRQSLTCLMDVWGSLTMDLDLLHEAMAELTRDRDESCFFFPFTPGMTADAARELERREKERREARHNRRIVVMVGIGSALIGAVVGALVSALLK